MWEKRNAQGILFGSPNGRRVPGILSISWVTGFKMCLKEIREDSVDRVYVTKIWEQVTTCCAHGNAPKGAKNYGEFFTISGPCIITPTGVMIPDAV